MFYAIVKSSSDTEAMKYSVIDDEFKLLQLIKEECSNCLEIDEMSLDKFEEEYDCDFDDYRTIRRYTKHLPKDFESFYFQLSDMTVELALFTDSIEEVEEFLVEEGCEDLFESPLSEENVASVLEAYCGE